MEKDVLVVKINKIKNKTPMDYTPWAFKLNDFIMYWKKSKQAFSSHSLNIYSFLELSNNQL